MKKKLSKLSLTRETLQQLGMATGGIPFATRICPPSVNNTCDVACYPPSFTCDCTG